MKKQLEDRYIVIKKSDTDASALHRLEAHLLANGISQRTGMFVELHHDVYPQVRNLCIYGTVYGPDLLSQQDIDCEVITTETCGEITRTVTERTYRSKPETVLSTAMHTFGPGDVTFGHQPENVSPEVTKHQAEQLGVKLNMCQVVQPIGYRCTRAFGHNGPCACESLWQAPSVPKPPSDLDMYAYYIQNGLTDYALKIEEAHLLVGYPPECVTVGLAAIEEGKDPIYAIQCYTEKSKAPEPVAFAPVPEAVKPPPQYAAPVRTDVPMPPPAPMMQPPAATYCAYDGCPGERMVGTRHCAFHQESPMAPVMQMAPVMPPAPEAPAPYHWGSNDAPAPMAPAPSPAPLMCCNGGCFNERWVDSLYCISHQPPPMSSDMPVMPVPDEKPTRECGHEGCTDKRRVGSRLCKAHHAENERNA